MCNSPIKQTLQRTIAVVLISLLAACQALQRPEVEQAPSQPTVQATTANSTTPTAEFPHCGAADSTTRQILDLELRFCLLFPATHTLFQPGDRQLVIAIGGLMNATDPKLSILVSDAAGRSSQQAADEFLTTMMTGFTVEQTTVKVDGVDAVLFDRLPGQDLNRRLFFVQNGRLYDLTFSPISEDAQALATFEEFYQKTLNSWRFLDPTIPPAAAAENSAEGSPATPSELTTYTNDAAGFSFAYPASWGYELGEIGERGGFVQYLAPDGTRLTATILDWDPKHDLAALIDSHKTAWDASGMKINDEQAWTLNNDQPASRFLVRAADDSEEALFLFTTLGDQYLILSGSGDLAALAVVAQSLHLTRESQP